LTTSRRNLFFADGAEHRRLRAPVDDAVHALRLRHVSRQAKEVCVSLIADFGPNGRADLVTEYALAVPMVAIGRMFGLGLEAAREMHLALMDVFAVNEKTLEAMARFEGIVGGLLRARQAEPADDMATVIARHPNHADDEERFESLTAVLACASENTIAWVAGALQLMLTEERFSGRLRGGRLGIDDALDEVLWRDAPASTLPARFALRDTELGGQHIRQGDALYLGFAAANADPRVHSDDQWNEIGNRSHLTWGAGPHACPAEVPTRIIVRTAVETALRQLPDMRLAVPAGEIARFPSMISRRPATLPVTFTPFTAPA
jgi:cytochrome P450